MENRENEKLESESSKNINFIIELATFYTRFEDYDKAFFYIEKAITNGIGDLMFLEGYDFFFKPLRSDPRYKKLLA